MKFVYLLPFTYFYHTRLRSSGVAFHAFFEWLAAVMLVLVVGVSNPAQGLLKAGLSYLAFISLYEIGYLVNDLFASHKEIGGRQRGPQSAGIAWVVAWSITRLATFMFATALMDKLASPEWWSFFASLSIVFALHNGLIDREFKVATFLWLAWFRFMAPVIFVVQDSQRLGVGLAAAMAYTTFRLLGYLDGKGLLNMPRRQMPGFRLFYFLMPLTGALALWSYEGAKGFLALTVYYALVAILGTSATMFRLYSHK